MTAHLISSCHSSPPTIVQCQCDLYHKVWEYFVYRDGHGLGSMAIHLAHHYFSFNMRNLTAS